MESLWHEHFEMPSFPRAHGERHAEVLVVGGGIAGVTAALLLQRAGKRVVLVEAGCLGGGETGRTTAHLTEILDTRYHVLESKFGRAGAHDAAESSRAAIERIEAFVRELGGGCGFRRLPGYLYAERIEQRRELEKELESLKRVGAAADWAASTPLPFHVEGAIRIEQQAQLHPLEYVRELALRFVGAGGEIFEQTPMLEVEDDEPCVVTTATGTITAEDVLVLTNVPVSNVFAIHTKIAAYRTYAVAAPSARELHGLFWDLDDPYHYTRVQETAQGSLLIVGGEDHKVGQKRTTTECHERLATWTRERFGADVSHRWSGQVIEPSDGLPFIGRNTGSEHVYVATGFSGTGLTFGTLAAMILSDEVLGVESPWAALYDATRVKPLAQARRYVTENVDFPAYLARDRLAGGEVRAVDEIPRGEGRLVRRRGKMLAVYRDDDGRLVARSAVCTHLGCNVRWNCAEKTWDCPCHGSRFAVDGTVRNGPAVKGLGPEPLDLPEEHPRPSL
jgi:glycine/D-amino acid oxidase-like deaminating enzyme/nitrite reductase/ring-hydroxylating ferredoxin subunit